MNIQISGLPDNQKIKSINFNIVFDTFDESSDSNIESTPHTNISVQKPKYSVETIETKPVQQEQHEQHEHQEVQKEIPKPSDIDISKREPKIDPNMLDEVF